MLATLVILLAATTLAVLGSRALGLGSILGYLVAGAVIGPSGTGLVTNIGQIATFSELGVVMLLFLIGLEVRPHRLWILRRSIFGLGAGFVLPNAVLLTCLAHAGGATWTQAVVLGAGLSLSSSAIVLPMLRERGLLAAPAGRDGFAVLLFQDMAFIPMVALVPLLGRGALPHSVPWSDVLHGVIAIAAILVGGTVLVRPLFRAVGGARTPELFTATALLLVTGTAELARWAGLSMSLGAFMAGVMLSDSEYRHEIQADVKPFEGLLLGFFFISVGMSADLGLAVAHPLAVATSVVVLLAIKIALGVVLGLIKRRSLEAALRFGLALPQGSEFSFVLFAAAVAGAALDKAVADLATLVVALSMAASPVLFAASERLLLPRLAPRRTVTAFDRIEPAAAPVILCGFGRVGQIVGRVLNMERISFTALDKSPEQVAVVRRFGGRVYFGNPTRQEVMRAAGAEHARVLVIALDDADAAIEVAEMARRHFPHLVILARARNRHHAHLLMEAGADGIIRETFHSSLRLSEMVLERLGVPPAEAHRAVELFRGHDERTLTATQAYAGDEQRLIQSTQEAAEELLELFEADRASRSASAGPLAD